MIGRLRGSGPSEGRLRTGGGLFMINMSRRMQRQCGCVRRLGQKKRERICKEGILLEDR